MPPSEVRISEQGGYRVIQANGVPNHEIGQFPGPGCPNAASAQSYSFRMPLQPKANATFTKLKQQAIGVALNGVPLILERRSIGKTIELLDGILRRLVAVKV